MAKKAAAKKAAAKKAVKSAKKPATKKPTELEALKARNAELEAKLAELAKTGEGGSSPATPAETPTAAPVAEKGPAIEPTKKPPSSTMPWPSKY